jgi:hypothetical protein
MPVVGGPKMIRHKLILNVSGAIALHFFDACDRAATELVSGGCRGNAPTPEFELDIPKRANCHFGLAPK